MERSAFAGRGAYINLSGMFLDDAVTYRETETGAAATGLGGKERVKDAMDVFARYAGARIGHFSRRSTGIEPVFTGTKALSARVEAE